MISYQGISFFLLLLLMGCKGIEKDNPSLSDRPFDIVRLTDLKNKPIGLKQYKGETIFLNFWATWCKPCKEEMPSIEKVQNILGDENIVFLMGSSERLEEITTFKINNNYKFNYARIENSEELDIQALPTTFIFNAEGKLVFSEMGFRKWDDSINIDMIRKIINKNE